MDRKKENRVDDVTLNHLLSLSHEALSFAPGLSGYYMNLYRRLSFKNSDYQNNIIKEDICSTCCTPKLAGITTNVEIIKKAKYKDTLLHNRQKSNDQHDDSQVNKVSDIQGRKEIMNNSHSSIFKPRTITLIDRYSRNVKKQRKKNIPEKKIVLPTTNLIKQQCKLCYTVTLRSGGTSRVHKIKDKESDKKLGIPKIGINTSKVEKNKKNKGQNSGQVPKKGLKNTLLDKSKKKVNKKLPAAKLMNLSKMLAKDKKAKDNNDKGNGFKLEDFLSGFK